MKAFGYTPFLDGLRALSIFYVIGFHGLGPGSSWLTGVCGWVGVENFFVISGFLITCLLLQEERETGKIDIKLFFRRRIFRIAPIYYFFLAFLLAKSVFGHHLNLENITVAAFYMTDYGVALGGGILHAPLLLHTWSLAIEEKFYLCYPLLLVFGSRMLVPVLVSLVIWIEVWKALLIVNGTSYLRIAAAFDTHIDVILIGCLAGIAWSRTKCRNWLQAKVATRWLPYILAIIVFISIQTIGDPRTIVDVNDRLLFWLLRLPVHAVLFSAFILSLMLSPTSCVAKALCVPLLVWLGRLSYSIYIWHPVTFDLVNGRLLHYVGQSTPVSELLKIILTIVIAAASYYLVEQPCLRLRRRLDLRKTANKNLRLNNQMSVMGEIKHKALQRQ